MSDVRLVVSGRRHGGWKSIRVSRSIESLAGSFSLEVADRWGGQDEPWPVAEEDRCQVQIDGETVIDGYVDRRNLELRADGLRVSFDGRDRAASLADCEALLDNWTFRRATVLDVTRRIAEPFGLSVSLQPGLKLPPPQRKFVVSPGEGALAAIERATRPAGVLVVSDGAGGIRLTRAGDARAAPLIEGANILDASVSYDATKRQHRYIVATQIGGASSGAAARVRAEAIDEGVRRTERVALVIAESGITADYARRRADWEARIRAARAETVSVRVVGWRQPDGELWPINAIALVRCPSIGVNGDMLISGVDYSIDGADGEVTQLSLVRPDAFTPEPEVAHGPAKVKRKGQRWKELEKGAR